MTLVENSDITINERDASLVDGIMRTLADDSRLAYRYRTIVKMNPYMASNPTAVSTMANMNLPTSQLMSQAGALYGLQTSNTLAKQLEQYNPSTQRAIFSSLTPAQQSTLVSFGYKVPNKDVHANGFFEKALGIASTPLRWTFGGIGKAVGPVISPTLEMLGTVGDYPLKMYRTIRQLDDASQWVALATGLVTAGAILAAPVTGGASSAAAAAFLTGARVGTAALGGMAAAGAASYATSAIVNGGTSTWANAWSAAYNGEKLFTRRGQQTARELLENDELAALAEDLAEESQFPGDLFNLAQEMAGTRDSDSSGVRARQLEVVAAKYAKPGTPAFQQIYNTISELLTQPAFVKAIEVLEKSKISIGRDVATGFGLFDVETDQGFGRWLSGSIDAVSLFVLDPFLILGGATRAAAQARRGLHLIEGSNMINRFEQIARLPEVERKLSVVASAVAANDHTLLRRGAKEYLPIFDKLVTHKQLLGKETYDAADVVTWLRDIDNLKSIARGVGVVPGVSLGQLRGLNRGQYLWAQATGSTRDVLRGIADVRIENVQIKNILKEIYKNPVLRDAYVNSTYDIPIDVTSRLMSRFGLSKDAARTVAMYASQIPMRVVLGETAESLDEFAEMIGRQADGQLWKETSDFLFQATNDSRMAYDFGRLVGNMPGINKVVQPFASLVEGITTRIPRSAIHLVGTDAPEDLRAYVDLFRYAGMPSYVRDAWANALILAPNPGQRLAGMTALMDSLATAAGLRLTSEGNDLLDKFLFKTRQMYGLDESAEYWPSFTKDYSIPIGTSPEAHMATMVPIPDLHEIRKAVKQGRLMNIMMGIPENTHLLAIQNRFWKPAVLMRIGFITRNVGEETLAMLVRYGTGRWAQEFAGRQVAQMENYEAQFVKAKARNQVVPLSPREAAVLEKRFDVPIPLRPLARAIDRLGTGQPWMRVIDRHQEFLRGIIDHGSDNLYNLYINGYGGRASSLLRRAATPLDTTTAKNRLQNFVKDVAFGNPYSIRRMIIGGVNPQILADARAFEGKYLKSILDQVGTTRLAYWQTANEHQIAAQRMVIDENSDERMMLVNVQGERGLVTRANPLPHHQPFHEAVLSRVEEQFDDRVKNLMADSLRRAYTPDLQQIIPREQLLNLLEEFGNFTFQFGRWDDELLQLWFILNEPMFNRTRLDLQLRRMRIEDDVIESFTSPKLQQWANNRNDLIDHLRTTFPGQQRPEWSAVVEAFYDAPAASYLKKRHVYTRSEAALDPEIIAARSAGPSYDEVDALTDDLIDISGQPVSTELPQKLAVSAWNTQIQVLSRMQESLTGVSDVGRERMLTMVKDWYSNPDLFDLNTIRARGTRPTPAVTLYIGKQFGELVEVGEDGSLIFTATPRNYFEPDVQAVSFSLSKAQASNYVQAQVKGGTDEDLIQMLFAVDGDAVLTNYGLTIDDVRGGTWDESVLERTGLTEGKVVAGTLQGPTIPFTSNITGHRELSFIQKAGTENVQVPWYTVEQNYQSNISGAVDRALFDLWEHEVVSTAKLNDLLDYALGETASAAGRLTGRQIFISGETKVAELFGATRADLSTELQSIYKNAFYENGKYVYNQRTIKNFNTELIGTLGSRIENYLKSAAAAGDLGDFSIDSLIKTITRVKETPLEIRIPAGAWSAEHSPIDRTYLPIDVPRPGNQDKIDRILAASQSWGVSPFVESIDDLERKMRAQALLELAGRDAQEFLELNPTWFPKVDSHEVFVIDTRTLGPSPVSVFNSEEAKTIYLNSGLEENAPDWITAAIEQQQPIIVSSREAANDIADVISKVYSLSRTAPGRGAARPAVGSAFIPGTVADLPQGWAMQPGSINGKNFRLFGWSDATSEAAYNEYPLIWNWLDSEFEKASFQNIADRALTNLMENIRGGRRVALSTRATPDAPIIYRNVNGEGVAMAPGEIVEGNSPLYLDPNLDPDSIVEFDDQRYFDKGPVSFEASDELLWPVISPVLYDKADSALGWSLFDLKNPIERAPLGSRRTEKIYTARNQVRYATPAHVAKTPAGHLPDWEIAQIYRPIKTNAWDRVVNGFFNKIASPIIDSLTRKPMAFHAFSIAAERNRAIYRAIRDGSQQEHALQQVISDVAVRMPGTSLTPQNQQIWGDFGRMVGSWHGDKFANDWSDVMAIGYLRGLDEREYEDIFVGLERLLSNPKKAAGIIPDKVFKSKAAMNRFRATMDFAQKNRNALQIALLEFGTTTDSFLNNIDRLFGTGSALQGRPMMMVDSTFGVLDDEPAEVRNFLQALTNDDWKAIKASAEQRAAHEEEVYTYAAEHAIRDVMPFVDSHEIRSQYAEFMRGLLPFWYAEENFLKRWAKIFTQGGPAVTLEKVRKLQLTYQGLRNVGIVRTDQQGNDYFVYPGSELFASAIEKVFPGSMVPMTTLLQTPTAQMVPGFGPNFGRPSASPFVAIKLNLITTLMPEARTLEEAIVGKEFAYNSIVSSIVPSQVSNVWNALGDLTDTDLNPKNERIASAMMAAIAHLEANGQGLPDSATPSQVDDYLRKIRNHARIIVFTQAVAGWFTPGPTSTLQIPEGNSLSWITNGAIENPAELFSTTYYELISNLGIEAGTQRFLELNANATLRSVLNPMAYTISKTATPSGAPLPTTDAGINFYLDNKGILEQYPEAGPWLLPQAEGPQTKRSQYAYDTEMVENLRERRSPEEFLRNLKYKEAAQYYFAAQREYNELYTQLRKSGRDAAAQNLNRQWQMESEAFKATHPLFTEMLLSDDARQRRRKIIDQMRYLVKDPLAPKASHFEALATLQRSYDAYSVARGELGLDRTGFGRDRLDALKREFRSWVDDFIIENPMVSSYWLTVLEPESGLE